jgi:hypothetical protein
VNDELLRLAERCEAATGPDREINRMIFATVKPDEFADPKEAAQYASPDYRGNNADWYYLSTLGLPRYTTSLDAAMSLVPEGWRPIINMASEEGAALADLWALPESSPKPTRKHAKAATPALALCAAALRSRAHRMGEGE